MRITIAVCLVTLFGCERAKPQPQAPKPVSVKVQAAVVAPALAPIEIDDEEDELTGPKRSHEPPPPRPDGLPNPPTDEPVAYKAWFATLPRTTQRKINSVCRKYPRAYQLICGGIGHLHIPYPPYPRARRRDEKRDPRLYFESSEQWHASLTAAQRRYIDRQCVGGEMMESSDLCGDNTPLVISFDNAPVQFTAGGTFAFATTPNATDWPTSATPWLVLDRDGDGAITSGVELFGDHTPGARTAFGALRILDANADGTIDARDPAFAQLQLWSDDGDQRSTPAELRPLAERVVSISLDNHLSTRCDARGNCEGERATLSWRDALGTLHEGATVDVYLPRRPSIPITTSAPPITTCAM
jgi:hypothetical protein